ncbi:MAG TPA: hypothetical protein VF614_12950 [Chthoniobacteraceae bacterium]
MSAFTRSGHTYSLSRQGLLPSGEVLVVAIWREFGALLGCHLVAALAVPLIQDVLQSGAIAGRNGHGFAWLPAIVQSGRLLPPASPGRERYSGGATLNHPNAIHAQERKTSFELRAQFVDVET